MTLIASISGIRGTIGGVPGNNLTPVDIVKFTSAYGSFILRKHGTGRLKVVTGRDARLSGAMVSALVNHTLSALGIDVVDLGLSTTPTVELAVTGEKAHGGIIITASHNPVQWNALKLLNERGEFISGREGEEVLRIAADGHFEYSQVEQLGSITQNGDWLQRHIDMVCQHPLVDVDAIASADLRIGVDAVNSTGGIALPMLLEALGVKHVEKIYCEPTGIFAHNPEPLPEHLSDLSQLVLYKKLHLGITVDPDVDRLAFVCEDGSVFGEEYTLVAVADYILSRKPGNTVSNLSSTRALRDVTHKHGMQYTASAVGEVNVVEAMKATGAVIGGEGNGGIIVPEFHYGRDALIGIGLFLSHLARTGSSASALRDSYPAYHISKNKMELSDGLDVDALLAHIADAYQHEEVNCVDGVKIDFAEGWVHLRKSNTEPIVRIYAEGPTRAVAEQLAHTVMDEIKSAIS